MGGMKASSFSIGLLAALLAVQPPATFAGDGPVIHVDQDATGPVHDGTSWCNAFVTLDEAIEAAVAGDTIRVADGTYTPDPSGLVDPRTATFQLENGVTIEGGYAGCGAADPDQRDIVSNETMLSGDLAGNDGPDFLNYDENAYHVVTGSGTDTTATLHGLTIRAGRADGAGAGEDLGAGMYNVNGNPTIISCTFTHNWAGRTEPSRDCCCEHDTPGCDDSSCEDAVCAVEPLCCTGPWNSDCVTLAWSECGFFCMPPTPCGRLRFGGGGGIYNENSAPFVTDCTFRRNLSEGEGGGIMNRSSSPVLADCLLVENEAFRDGGGIYSDSASNPRLVDSAFVENATRKGGGGMFIGGSSGTTVTGCTFIGNSSGTFAAGLSLFGSLDSPSSPTIIDCRFLGNDGLLGGAASVWRGNPTFVNCLFSGNTAFTGAGVLFSAADPGNSPQMVNCTFSRNSARLLGGGVYNDTRAILTNCVLWGNDDRDGIDESAQFHNATGFPTLTYTLIQGLTEAGPWDRLGNIGGDPLFVNANGSDDIPGTDDDNLRLARESPCIDAGNNSAVTVATDLDGNPRITGVAVDMGAYELPSTCGNGDCEGSEDPCNCTVDCGPPTESEVPGSSCADGKDNDCDGSVDCRDVDCIPEPGCAGQPVPALSVRHVVLTALLLLAGGSIVFSQRRRGFGMR